MTILCGTDFSESSDRAARVAAAIARRLGEPLALVHVVSSSQSLTGDPPEAVTARALPEVRRRATQLHEEYQAEVEAVALAGTPEETLVELARQSKVTLMVVGALGGKRQRSWRAGSVAERVAQCSPAPVVVVREAAGLLAWTRGERALRIMVGVEPDASSLVAARWAAGLRRVGPCDITLAQIAFPPREHAHLGMSTLASMDKLRPEIEALLLRDLRAWAGALPGEGETTFSVTPGWGRVDTHLTLLASEAEVDLLVVGTHRRSYTARLWQGSVSRGAIHYAGSSVACIPRDTQSMPEVTAPLHSVLVPTDFSPLANRAIATAYAMLPSNGVVHLLHVRTAGTDRSEDDEARLRALVPPEAAKRGIETEIHVVAEREAHLGIVHLAARLGVDAICMSTHGRSGALQLLAGSQAQQVLARTRKPVLFVPPERAE